jgi:hypothetical protein
MDGNVMDVGAVDVQSNSLSFDKEVSASSNLKAHWSNHQWVDMQSVTNGDWSGEFWHPSEEDSSPWLEIDLADRQKVHKAVIYERGQNIKAFELQYRSGPEWITLYDGTEIGERAEITLPETEMKLFRMRITSFDEVPGIYEIVLL